MFYRNQFHDRRYEQMSPQTLRNNSLLLGLWVGCPSDWNITIREEIFAPGETFQPAKHQ